MKLKEHMVSLGKMIEKDPQILEFDVVYSTDDEGNNFEEVRFSPDLGVYDKYSKEWDNARSSKKKFNSICIN